MMNIYCRGLEKPNVIVVGNSPESIAYKMVNEQYKSKLEKIKEGQYFTDCSLTKIYLVANDLNKSIKTIANLEGDVLIHLDTFNLTSILDTATKFGVYLTTNNYNFNLKSTKKEDSNKNFYLSTMLMIEYSRAVEEGIIIGNSINNAKMLVDKPLSHLNSIDLANYCLALKSDKLDVKVLGLEEIKKLKMDSFLAVNKGSSTEPKLIEMTLKNNPNNDEFTWLIGKGLTFDTGGYSLKPGSSMVNMKSDMGGAASVISAIEALSKLNAETNLKVLVLATDNKVSSDAIVPDDVITTMSGKTVEIVSTDAEGRLTLCDAITYAVNNNAKKIIDLATLTGSAAATFGDLYTAGFTNKKEYLEQLIFLSEENNEPIWQLPLNDKYLKVIESEVADFKNSGKSAGASVAAIFLKQFIPSDVEWIHLDIAGTATNTKGSATGVLVKTLVDFLKI